MSRLSRRRFLQATAALAAAGSLAPYTSVLSADEQPADKIHFGLVTYQWGRDWDLPTLIANCEKTGLLGVELRTTHKHGVEPSLDAAQRGEVKKRLADSSLQFVGIGCNECYDSPDPEKLRRSIEATRAFLQLGHDIGASGVKVKPNDFHEGVEREKTIEQIGRSLNEVGKIASDLGQEVRLEVHGQCADLPTMKKIMDFVTEPGVGLCWNSNAQDLKGEGLEFNFNLVKDRFGRTAHVRQLTVKDYPYQELFNLFVGMDFNGWILLEAHADPPDRLVALAQEKAEFDRLLAEARGG